MPPDIVMSQCRQNLEELLVILSVLPLQIQHRRLQFLPRFRIHHETAALLARTIDWRQLEKVTTHHQLHATKWLVVFPDTAQHLIDHIQPKIMQHGNLINHQHISLGDHLTPRF